MSFQRTTVRALVPYKAPRNGVALAFKALLRRLFVELDKHFAARKNKYLLVSFLSFWGLLLGGFYTAELFYGRLSFFFIIHCVAVFFSGFTIFGVAVVPASVLWVFSTVGSIAGSIDSFDFFSAKLLMFAFFYLFLCSESIACWERGRLGWKKMFFHRDFLIGCVAVLLSIVCII